MINSIKFNCLGEFSKWCNIYEYWKIVKFKRLAHTETHTDWTVAEHFGQLAIRPTSSVAPFSLSPSNRTHPSPLSDNNNKLQWEQQQFHLLCRTLNAVAWQLLLLLREASAHMPIHLRSGDGHHSRQTWPSGQIFGLFGPLRVENAHCKVHVCIIYRVTVPVVPHLPRLPRR